MIPITKTFAEMGIDAPEPTFTPDTGRDWFERQDEATQRKIMGSGKYDAWKDGRFNLEDIPHKTHSDVWGDSWTPAPLYELLGEKAPVGSYQGWVAAEAARKPKVIEWRPSMSQAEAEVWAKDSVFKDTVYHGTYNHDIALKISEDGFNLDFVATGRHFGDGVYTAIEQETALSYATNEENVLSIKINANNMLTVEAYEMEKLYSDSLGWAFDNNIRDISSSQKLTRYLQSKGYDSLRINSHDYIVIFDPKNVTVIK